MDITTYTSYAEVRSACGVSAKEVSDTELGLEIYANSLELDLSRITLPDVTPGPGPLMTTFVTIAAIDEAERTAKEQLLYNLTRLFCTYAVAGRLATSLSMSIPKSITDSKSSLTRFSSEETFRTTMDGINQAMNSYRYAIENINVEDYVPASLLTVVSPTVDKVTGE